MGQMAALHNLRDRTPPSYQKIILAQCQKYPCLWRLSQFYEESLSQRHPCRLACLEFSSSNEKPPLKKDLDIKGLAQMMQNPHERSDDLLGRMLIVEDLNANVIELLGSSLEIDPLFFASHLHVARSEKTAQQPDVRLLPSTVRHLKFISTIYHRALIFKANPVPHRLLCDANVRRKTGSWEATDGISVGLTQRCFSTLMSNKEGGAWFGKKPRR
jgi:hypothetical protein